jgi:geranylgeranyl diphosphate/geranylgeranyl-bacteriochlorophyllide a reductase
MNSPRVIELSKEIQMSESEFDAVVVGGGPAGSTAAWDLARAGYRVALLDRGGRVKPCGGAVPPKLLQEFEVDPQLLVARIQSARIVAPSNRRVDMPIEDGYVGMVDRETFDEWLRQRAAAAGVQRITADFVESSRLADGTMVVRHATRHGGREPTNGQLRTRYLIGADGAASAVARQFLPDCEPSYVYAYHEIVRSPVSRDTEKFDAARCDIYYQSPLSPDFYGWIFPHGDTTSIGTGTARRGFSIRSAVGRLREAAGLAGAETLRREGAPIPMKPLKRWDDGKNVVLAGDAAGVVAPASGEGIYYAMTGGRLAATAVLEALRTGDARALAGARKQFMRLHGRVFWILEWMQNIWYASDRRRERFVALCDDKDIQRLTWEAYLNKRLVRARPLTHLRIFVKDLAHLLHLVRV